MSTTLTTTTIEYGIIARDQLKPEQYAALRVAAEQQAISSAEDTIRADLRNELRPHYSNPADLEKMVEHNFGIMRPHMIAEYDLDIEGLVFETPTHRVRITPTAVIVERSSHVSFIDVNTDEPWAKAVETVYAPDPRWVIEWPHRMQRLHDDAR